MFPHSLPDRRELSPDDYVFSLRDINVAKGFKSFRLMTTPIESDTVSPWALRA